MDANEIRRQEAERDYLLRVNETGAAYRPVRIDGTPAKGSIAADLKAAQEEIQRLVLQINELKERLQHEMNERNSQGALWVKATDDLKESNRLNDELRKLAIKLRKDSDNLFCKQPGCEGCEDMDLVEKRVRPDQKICGAMGITGGLCQNPIPCPLH